MQPALSEPALAAWPCSFRGDAGHVPRVLAMPSADGTTPEACRQNARRQARAVLRQRLSSELGLPPHLLLLSDVRGTRPRATRSDGVPDDRLAVLGLSISHAPGLSLVAWWPDGAVGVDVQALPQRAGTAELLDVAALYLGPQVHQALARQSRQAGFLSAFSLQWAMHEARLKCLGQPLTEWTPVMTKLNAASVELPSALAGGHVAAIAWQIVTT